MESIYVDGVSLSEILKKLSGRIDSLHKNNNHTTNIAATGSYVSVDIHNQLLEKIEVLEARVSTDTEKIATLSHRVQVLESGKPNDSVKNLIEKIDLVDSNNKIQCDILNATLSSRIIALESDLRQARVRAEDESSRLTELTKTVNDVERVVAFMQAERHIHETKYNEMNEKFLFKMKSAEAKISDLLAKLASFTNQLESLFKMLEEVSDKVESNHAACSEEISVLRTSLDGLMAEKILVIMKELKKLEGSKATVSDLMMKVNFSDLDKKADIDDIHDIKLQSDILSQKLEQFKGKVTDGVNRLHKGFDAKIDALIAWVAKMMRKMGAEVQGDSSGDVNGDIGKVKCLVCDQPIRQLTTQEIVFGGPPLPHSLRSKRDFSPLRGQPETESPDEPDPISASSNRNMVRVSLMNRTASAPAVGTGKPLRDFLTSNTDGLVINNGDIMKPKEDEDIQLMVKMLLPSAEDDREYIAPATIHYATPARGGHARLSTREIIEDHAMKDPLTENLRLLGRSSAIGEKEKMRQNRPMSAPSKRPVSAGKIRPVDVRAAFH